MSIQLTGGSLRKHIYSGLLDDATEYPEWPDGGPTLAGMHALLRRAALFEHQLLLNDGYLLHYDWGRKELCDPDSLLRRLIKAGFIVIFTREPDGHIENVPERMALGKIQSYHKLIASADWLNIKKKLSAVSTSDEFRWAKWFSADNKHGFDRLLAIADAVIKKHKTPVYGVDPTIWTKTYDQFRITRGKEAARGARDIWQESVRNSPKNYRGSLLNIGNQAYHINMAALFAGESNLSMAVQTILSPLFISEFSEIRTRPYRQDHSYHLRAGLNKLHPGDFVEKVALSHEVLTAKAEFLLLRDMYERGAIYSVDRVEAAQERLFDVIQETAFRAYGSSRIRRETRETVSSIMEYSELVLPEPTGHVAAAATAVKYGSKFAKYFFGFHRYRPEVTHKAFANINNQMAGTIWLEPTAATKHYTKTLERIAAIKSPEI